MNTVVVSRKWLVVCLGCAWLGVSALAEARPVTAVWDANTDPFTVGYRLYYGISPGNHTLSVDVGNVTSLQFDLPPGTHYFVVRAYNSGGQLGPPSNEATMTVTTNNQAPRIYIPNDLVAPTGPVSVQIPASDPDGDALTYTATGLPSAMTVNPSTGLVSGVLSPAGTYNVTITVSDGSLSTQTNFRLTIVGTGCPGPPSLTTLRPATVNGNQVVLSWSGPPAGIPPTSYVVQAGTAPGLSNIASVVLPTSMTGVATVAPSGRYFVRIAGRNACGDTVSNEISFLVGSPPRDAPSLTFERSGRTVTLSWAPSTAGSVSGYQVEVGSAAGYSNLAVLNTGSSETSFTTTALPGQYFIRVRAVTANGVGSPSNEVVVPVP